MFDEIPIFTIKLPEGRTHELLYRYYIDMLIEQNFQQRSLFVKKNNNNNKECIFHDIH